MDDKIIYLILGLVGLLLIILSILSQLRNDIARINTTLAKISKQIGVPDAITENIDRELVTLISDGKKIKAIQEYRMHTGLGLKESKEYVDSIEQKLD